MKRPLGYLAFLAAVASAVGASLLDRYGSGWPTVEGAATLPIAVTVLSAAAVAFASYGLYLLVTRGIENWSASKQRAHDVTSVLRLGFLVGTGVAVLAVVTEQWAGLLVSFGVVGFAVTFALQQPLLSLIGWLYILLKRPYKVGDRVKIEDARGDVIEVDFLVTTLWEVGGDLVSGHQPSGRMVTVPNSVVLSAEVYNYSLSTFPYVWNELAIQVSYETDLAFAREEMVAAADELIGDEMERRVARYREALAETPVELEVRDRPSVNVTQGESWVELRLRYLVDPKRMQRTRNQLYEAIFERFREHPDRISYPVGRFR